MKYNLILPFLLLNCFIFSWDKKHSINDLYKEEVYSCDVTKTCCLGLFRKAASNEKLVFIHEHKELDTTIEFDIQYLKDKKRFLKNIQRLSFIGSLMAGVSSGLGYAGTFLSIFGEEPKLASVAAMGLYYGTIGLGSYFAYKFSEILKHKVKKIKRKIDEQKEIARPYEINLVFLDKNSIFYEDKILLYRTLLVGDILHRVFMNNQCANNLKKTKI